MLSKIICLLLCSGFIFQSLAQQYLADSIHKELRIESKPLNRIDLHLGLVRAYAFTEDDEAQAKYIDSCFYLAKKHNFKKAEIYARIFRANLDFSKGGTPDSYYVVLEESLRDAREISARNEEVFVLYHLSDYYGGNLNKLSKSRRILEDVLNTPSPKFSRKNKAYVSKHLGYTLFSEGKDSLAIAYLEKAISLFDSIETHPEIDPLLGRTPAMEWDQGLMGKGMALIYLGRVYTKLGQFDKALQFVNAASKIYEQTASLSFYAWTRADSARIYEYKGLLSEANENFQIAIKGYEKSGAIQDLKFAY
ncbi:MAG: tetratricopeptide repeat protein, partial [Bacteroidota bacterium]